MFNDTLDTIERVHGVRVLYACESGSRAWGFESKDSDFDVRFLYIRPVDWYLSVNLKRRDVIELPIDGNLDVNGWDFRKALGLYYKSNPPLLEWLGSPIVYREAFSVAQKLRDLSEAFYNPIACMYHYFHMAEGNHRQYLKGDQVWIKKYFYVLRPLLAVNWLERDMGVVPTRFSELLTVVSDDSLLARINELVESKRNGCELHYGPRIPEIGDFIDREIDRLAAMKFDKPRGRRSYETLDSLFRLALDEAWG